MSVDKVRGYNFHPWAVCITADCSWSRSESEQTRRLAKEHANIRGHHVEVVQENRDHYASTGYDFAASDRPAGESYDRAAGWRRDEVVE